MTRPLCPSCQHQLIEPIGDPKAKLLLMGEFAGYKEMEVGYPFVADAGVSLRYELGRVGINYGECRVTNLYPHDHTKDCDKDRLWKLACKEIANHPYALLMGSEFGWYAVPGGVSEYNGRMLKFPSGTSAILTMNPAAMENDGPGEFRFALTRLLALMEGKHVRGSINVPPIGEHYPGFGEGKKGRGGRGPASGKRSRAAGKAEPAVRVRARRRQAG